MAFFLLVMTQPNPLSEQKMWMNLCSSRSVGRQRLLGSFMNVRHFVLLCLHVSATVCESGKDRRAHALASPNDDSKMSHILPLLKVMCSEKELANASVLV